MAFRQHTFIILFIIIATFLVYYDSFNNSFVYDDRAYVEENKAIRSLDASHILSFFSDRDTVSSDEGLSRDVWRPLMTLSFALDYRLWKLRPRFYHIENTAVHVLNAILVYLLTFLIVGDEFAAALCAVVFAIHPVQTESVTWVSGRSNVLFLFFILCAMVLHVYRRKVPTKLPLYGAALAFFTAGLLSKETAIILPVLCGLYDLYFCRGGGRHRFLVYYLPFAAVAGFYLAARYATLGVFAQRGWWGSGINAHFLGMLHAFTEYVRLVMLPMHLKVDYMKSIPSTWFDPRVLIAGTIFIAIALICAFVRKRKEIPFYALWFAVALLPVSNIIPLRAMVAERFLYLPMIAFASLFGIFFAKAYTSSRAFFRYGIDMVIVLILVFYGAGTIARNIEWRNREVFYTNEMDRSPDNPRFHYDLAVYYHEEGLKNEAVSADAAHRFFVTALEEYKQAVALKPDFDRAYIGIASLSAKFGLHDQALANYRKALVFDKQDYKAYNGIAAFYYQKGMFDETLRYCRMALQAKPDFPAAYTNIGNAYYMKSNYGRARRAWQYAVALGEDDPMVAENLATLTHAGF